MVFRRAKLCIFIWPFEAQERGCAFHLVEINILLRRNSIVILFISSPVSIYLHKVNNRNDRIKCSKLTIQKPERRLMSFDFFIVTFEPIYHLVLVFPLLTLKMQLPAGFRAAWNCLTHLFPMHSFFYTLKQSEILTVF